MIEHETLEIVKLFNLRCKQLERVDFKVAVVQI